jgi:hypothetical protein
LQVAVVSHNASQAAGLAAVWKPPRGVESPRKSVFKLSTYGQAALALAEVELVLDVDVIVEELDEDEAPQF